MLYDPWIILVLTAPTSVYTNNSSLVNADLTHDSNYNVSDPAASEHDPTSGHIPDGIPIVFDPGTMGTMDIINRTSSNGKTAVHSQLVLHQELQLLM